MVTVPALSTATEVAAGARALSGSTAPSHVLQLPLRPPQAASGPGVSLQPEKPGQGRGGVSHLEGHGRGIAQGWQQAKGGHVDSTAATREPDGLASPAQG